MSAVAVDSIVIRARRIAEKWDPHHVSLAQHELAGALAVMTADDRGYVEVMADSIRLVLTESDQHRLDKLAAVRKDRAVWEHERLYEQSRRRYLGEDVLKDAGSTVIWWLNKNDGNVQKTVADIGPLAELFAAANNTSVPEHLAGYAAAFASPSPIDPDDLNLRISDMPDPADMNKSNIGTLFAIVDNAFQDEKERNLVTARIARIFKEHGNDEIVAEMARRTEGTGSFDEEADTEKETKFNYDDSWQDH